MFSEEGRRDRKRGANYLYGYVGGCLNLIFWGVVAIMVILWIAHWLGV